MKDEIKEILDNQKLINVEDDYERIIFEYLANNCSEFDDEHIKQLVNLKVEQYKQSLDYITNLQEENTKLKQKLNCKEYFSSTMPENTEFVILTKENYDRQQKDIQLELIEAKLRIDKAIEYIEKHTNHFVLGANKEVDEFDYISTSPKALLNILKGEDKK